MKKNGKILSIMLRNNNYFNTSKNMKIKANNVNKIKYDISTTSNIINEYKKLSKTKILNSNSIYNRNNSLSKIKELFSAGLLSYNNNFYKKNNENNDIYNNLINNKNISINQNENNDLQDNNKSNNNTNNNKKIYNNNKNNNNNIYEDDTINSSMETIKKILYSTDSKKEVKNNIIKNSQLNGIPNLKDIFNYKIINEKNSNLDSLDKNKNIKELKYMRKTNNEIFENDNKNIDNSFLNTLNKKLTLNSKRAALKSMKLLKSKTNYDLDNIDYINISDEFNNNIIPNNIINNNNYIIEKINNNININNKLKKPKKNKKSNNIDINNNQTNKFNNEKENNTSRYNNIDIDIDFLDNNNIINDKYNDISYLREKIKELSKELNNKTILINEYSTLAQKSKVKFEQLIIHNKKNIEKIKDEAKNQSMLYKSKIMNLEKEKRSILNKYLENKKYTEALEGLLFNQKYDNTISDEDNRIKRLEEIIKKLINDISGLKKQLEIKNKDNENLKNIIMKYRDVRNRDISNPRTHMNYTEQIKKKVKKLKKSSPNLIKKSTININKEINNDK